MTSTPARAAGHGAGHEAVAALLREGDAAGALRRALASLKGAPADPVLCRLAAVAALRLGRGPDAMVLAARALDADPDHVPTLLVRGRAARAAGAPAEARAAFARAAACAPALAEPRFLLCAVLLETADPEAGPRLDDLLARFPAEASWEEVGQVLFDAGKREAALVCFTRAFKAKPRFALAMRRGLMLRDLGRAGEAEAAFAEAVGLDPGAARAHFALGLCRQDGRAWAQAAASYRAALRLDPHMAEAAVNLGTVLQEAGDLDGAKAAYASAMAIRPDTFGRIAQAMTTAPRGELWLDLGRLRRSLGA